jgi:hypothetical protein
MQSYIQIEIEIEIESEIEIETKINIWWSNNKKTKWQNNQISDLKSSESWIKLFDSSAQVDNQTS